MKALFGFTFALLLFGIYFMHNQMEVLKIQHQTELAEIKKDFHVKEAELRRQLEQQKKDLEKVLADSIANAFLNGQADGIAIAREYYEKEIEAMKEAFEEQLRQQQILTLQLLDTIAVLSERANIRSVSAVITSSDLNKSANQSCQEKLTTTSPQQRTPSISSGVKILTVLTVTILAPLLLSGLFHLRIGRKRLSRI